MKRKLLGILILYVLGAALLQNIKSAVGFSAGEAVYESLEAEFTNRLVGTVTGLDESKNSHIIYMQTEYRGKPFGICCYLKKGQEQPAGIASACHIGDLISVSGSLKKPELPKNPGQFNQYIYYRARGRDFLCYPRELTILKSAENKKCNIGQILYIWKCKMAGIYDLLLKKEDSGVLKAMLLGDKSSIPEEISQLYQKNNISHILAISGLHLGLLSRTFYGFLRLLGCSYGSAGAVGILAAFSYGAMTGASDGTMRAAVMIAIYMVGEMLGRSYDLLTAMGISLAVFVTVNPLKLHDAAFLFSYGAIAGIGIVFPYITAGGGQRKNSGKQQEGRIKKAATGVFKSLALSLSVQLVTLPVSLHFYGELAPYSLLLNIIVIPLMTPILLFGFTGGILGFIVPEAAGWFLRGAALLVHAITWLCKAVQSFFGASVILGAMEWQQMIIYYISLCIFLALVRSGKGKKTRVILVGIMFLMAVYRSPVNRMTMLDVGQGSSILLQTKTGLNILVDGGSTSEADVGKYVIAPALKYYGVRRLDYIIITHADQDHINGLFYLMEHSRSQGVEIGELLMPELCRDMEEYRQLKDKALLYDIHISYLKPGMTLTTKEFRITCIHPAPKEAWEDINDMSTVLSVCYGKIKIMLTGDISASVEGKLCKNKKLIADTDILQVAHHGSRYSTSEKFLKTALPEAALISCGKNNTYGHPHQETIERLKALNSKIYNTAEGGAVIMWTDGEKFQIKQFMEPPGNQ